MDEIKATYGTTAEIKIQLINADGETRTFSIDNPKTTISQEVINNVVNLILDSDTNVFAVVSQPGKEQPVKVVIDKVITQRTNLYGGGDDTITNTVAGSVINALGGNDSINNIGNRVTIDAGAGKDTITNTGTNAVLNGGASD